MYEGHLVLCHAVKGGVAFGDAPMHGVDHWLHSRIGHWRGARSGRPCDDLALRIFVRHSHPTGHVRLQPMKARGITVCIVCTTACCLADLAMKAASQGRMGFPQATWP